MRYISVPEALALHTAIMERTGERPAPVRDENLFESAVMRPRMYRDFEQADLIRQCAVLAVGLSQAQALVSGNKRTAYIVADAFLRRNGLMYSGDPLEMSRQLEAVAERTDSFEAASGRFEAWLRLNVDQRRSSG